jgi:phage terminase large subunit-like protein
VGQRDNPIGWGITTPGTDKLTIAYRQYTYLKNILDGLIEDDSYWGVIYETDPNADIYSPITWAIGNPLYEYSENLRDDIAKKAKQAQNDPAEENKFRRLNLGQWTQSETRWMKSELWQSLRGQVTPADFEGEITWLGLDLSSTSDLTSLCRLYNDDGIITPFWDLWIPEAAAEKYEKKYNIPYSLWAKQGHINIVSGNTIDFSAVEDKILEIASKNSVWSVGYDEWNSRDLASRLQERHGMQVMVNPQGYRLSNALKKIKELIMAGNMLHSGNPVVMWAFDNITIKENDEANIKIVKPKTTGASEREEKKIDPWISLAMAVNEWMIYNKKPSVYLTRGVQVIE